MPVKANRGIAVPTVIIALLFASSAAGWVLYYKNEQTLEDMVVNEARLSAQLTVEDELQTTIKTLESSQLEASSRIEKLDSQTRSLQSEVEDKQKLQSELDEANQNNTQLTGERDQAKQRIASLVEQRDNNIQILEQVTADRDGNMQLLEQVTAQRDGHIQRLDTVIAERNGKIQMLEQVTAERDGNIQMLEQVTAELDGARESDQRGRQQLAELVAKVESSQQSSEKYRTQLDSARGELATTSEKADALIERIQQLEIEREKERQALDELREKLNASLGEKSVTIEQSRSQPTVIRLQGDVLFDSGSVQLLKSARQALASIGDVLGDYPERQIEVVGHTDNVPVSSRANYPTNWELSAARASSAARCLIANSNITPRRLRIAGVGEYNPIADNGTAAGRSQNRRIEIKLLPSGGLLEVSADGENN